MSFPTTPPAKFQTVPDSPPEEVLDAIAVAGDVYERLRASGRQVRFELEPDTGWLRASLRDESGRVLARLTAGDVIDLATGADPRLQAEER
ncbi:MAG: hypothetical protein ACRDMX_04715 [Solirubrobacteraceae bacterium]